MWRKRGALVGYLPTPTTQLLPQIEGLTQDDLSEQQCNTFQIIVSHCVTEPDQTTTDIVDCCVTLPMVGMALMVRQKLVMRLSQLVDSDDGGYHIRRERWRQDDGSGNAFEFGLVILVDEPISLAKPSTSSRRSRAYSLASAEFSDSARDATH